MTASQPLVSLIVRSADRPCLGEALASIRAQTHPSIEIVVVNVTGRAHSAISLPGDTSGRSLRLVAPAAGMEGRAGAANAGLDAAQGHYLGFLDDDDLLDPTHVAKLVAVLEDTPAHRVAYSGVRLEDRPGHVAGVFDEPFDAAHLLAGNFLPIHAVLFERSLLEMGCRFDARFELFEDWDFWLQLARHGDFLHAPGCTAVYRRWLGQSDHLGQGDADRRRDNLLRLYAKWHGLSEAAHWGAAWVDVRRQLDGCHAQAGQLQARVAALEAEAARAGQDRQALQDELARMRRSLSWRLTAPLRRVNGWLHRLRGTGGSAR